MAKSKGLSTSYIMVQTCASAFLVLDARVGGPQHRYAHNWRVRRRVPLRPERDRVLRSSTRSTPRLLEVQGMALVVALVYVFVNFFVNFLYTVLDPRIARA